jgi:hypothetical protein
MEQKTPMDELGETYSVEYDSFVGTMQGSYVTREGREGVVLQQVGTKVVHVYGRNRIKRHTEKSVSE